MAINIQEILHPSDSDAIKFEKINYNFDQIVAAGGGPSGQKGQIGDQGAVGPQGQQGIKGEKGDQGPVGATTSPWQAISVTSAQANPYTILKPKLSTDTHQPVIFVGDVTFNENTPEDGLTSLRGSINIGRHSMVANDASPEYINLWHGSNVSSSQNHAIQISSADSQEFTGVRWTFGRLYGSPDPSVSADELYIDFNRLNFGATAKVGFDGQDSSFKLPLSNSAGLSGTPELGMIRFNAGVYQGVIDVNGTPTWTNFCMAPCGQGGGETYSIEIQPGDDLQLNSEGGPANNSVSFSPAGDVELDENGNTWNGGAGTTTTSTTTTTLAPSPPEDTTTTTSTTSTTTTSTTTTTAPPITYDTLTVSTDPVNEGNSFILNVTTSNVPDGTQVWVQLTSGAQPADFTNIDPAGSAGGNGSPYGGGGGGFNAGLMMTITGGTGGASFNVAADQLTEGDETATFTLYPYDSDGNSTGELSRNVTISDTSTAPVVYNLSTSPFTGGGLFAACAGNVGQGLTYTGTFGNGTIVSGYTATQNVMAKIYGSNEPGFSYGGGSSTNGWVFGLTPQLGGGAQVVNLTQCYEQASVDITDQPSSGAIYGSEPEDFEATAYNFSGEVLYSWELIGSDSEHFNLSAVGPVATLTFDGPYNAMSAQLRVTADGNDNGGNSVTKTDTVSIVGFIGN